MHFVLGRGHFFEAAVGFVFIITFFNEFFVLFELSMGVEVQVVQHVVFQGVVQSLGKSVFITIFGMLDRMLLSRRSCKKCPSIYCFPASE